MGPRRQPQSKEAVVVHAAAASAATANHGQRKHRRDNGHPKPEEFGLQDPTACINACRDQFVTARTGESGDNYREICRLLSQQGSGHNEALQELYLCDSTYCGVANCAADLDREFNKTVGRQVSRNQFTNRSRYIANVDLLINICRRYVVHYR